MVVPDRAKHPEYMFQRQRFLRKFPNISGFYLGLPPFLLQPPETCNIYSLIILDILRDFRDSLREKTCTLVKGEESLHLLEKISKLSLLFIINSDMFSSSVISVISLSMAE